MLCVNLCRLKRQHKKCIYSVMLCTRLSAPVSTDCGHVAAGGGAAAAGGLQARVALDRGGGAHSEGQAVRHHRGVRQQSQADTRLDTRYTKPSLN